MRTHADKLAWLNKLAGNETINSAQFRIAFCLLSRLNLKTQQCSPSMGEIAIQSGYQARAVQKAVRALEEAGVIAVHRSTGGTSENTSTFDFTGGKKKPVLTPVQMDALPEGLDVAAWAMYLEYRRESGLKKLTPGGCKVKIKWMIEQGEDQQAVVDQTMGNGWTGLFELKGGGNGKSRRSGKDRNTVSGDIYRELYDEAVEQECGHSIVGAPTPPIPRPMDSPGRHGQGRDQDADGGLAESPTPYNTGGSGCGLGQVGFRVSAELPAIQDVLPGFSGESIAPRPRPDTQASQAASRQGPGAKNLSIH